MEIIMNFKQVMLASDIGSSQMLVYFQVWLYFETLFHPLIQPVLHHLFKFYCHIQTYKQNMPTLRLLFVFVCLIGTIIGFPDSTTNISPFTVDPANVTLLKTMMNIQNNVMVYYTTALGNSSQTLSIYKWSPTMTSTVKTYKYAEAIGEIGMSLLSSQLTISLKKASVSSFELFRLYKANLTESSNTTTMTPTTGGSGRVAAIVDQDQPLNIPATGTTTTITGVQTAITGVYLSRYQIYIYYKTSEIVVVNPQVTNLQIASFPSPTSFPETTKYLYPQDQSQLFTFYKDQNYFLVRNLSSNLETLARQFNSPAIITLTSTGYQCACFDDNDQYIFILDNNGIFLIYEISSSTLMTIDSTTYTGITDCYYESSTSGINFIADLGLATSFYHYSFLSLRQSATYFTRQTSFMVDFHQRVITSSMEKYVGIYKIGKVSCQTSYYYDADVSSCSSCQASIKGCTSCMSSQICNGCGKGYTFDSSSISQPCVASGNRALREVVKNFMDNTAINTLNSVPGSRKIPFLCFFANFDQLWLYQYHQRDYGSTMGQFFESIQKMENQKWNLLETSTTDTIYAKLGTSKAAIYDAIDTKLNYTQPTFRRLQNRGSTFLPACWEFLTFNLFFVLIAFALLRWGFKLLFNHRISVLLRPFSSVIFLAPMLLDGNLQYFCFLLFSQISMGFSLNATDKAFNVLNYLIYFFVIWFSVVSCFICYYLNKKLAKYMIDYWRTRVHGLLNYFVTNAIRHLIFGAIHSLLRNNPLQVPILLGCQICYVVFLLMMMSYWKMTKVAYKVWFTVCFVSLRMCLQVMFILQQQGIRGTAEQTLIEDIIGSIILLYTVTFYVATIWTLFEEIYSLITMKKIDPQTQDKKQKMKNKSKQGETQATTGRAKIQVQKLGCIKVNKQEGNLKINDLQGSKIRGGQVSHPVKNSLSGEKENLKGSSIKKSKRQESRDKRDLRVKKGVQFCEEGDISSKLKEKRSDFMDKENIISSTDNKSSIKTKSHLIIKEVMDNNQLK